MNAGGYQILDFKGADVASEHNTTIEGMYELIESSTKPLMTANLTFEGKEFKNSFIEVYDNTDPDTFTHRYCFDRKINTTDSVIVYVDSNDKVTAIRI